eukprot:COSAG06_NODE_64526_length_259_cov_0.650000_1_plen_65_part_10
MAALPEFEDGVPIVVEYDLTYAADHIAIFWLSRPEAKNAVNGAPRASRHRRGPPSLRSPSDLPRV